jgi:hypothetical protein
MIYFIGPVHTASVSKTNVLSVCRYTSMHQWCHNLLFEVENFAHRFCIFKYICAGWYDFLYFKGIEALLIYFVGMFSFPISLVCVLNNYLVRRMSCWILSITNYLSPQCLHILRQRFIIFCMIYSCFPLSLDAVMMREDAAWSTHFFLHPLSVMFSQFLIWCTMNS